MSGVARSSLLPLLLSGRVRGRASTTLTLRGFCELRRAGNTARPNSYLDFLTTLEPSNVSDVTIFRDSPANCWDRCLTRPGGNIALQISEGVLIVGELNRTSDLCSLREISAFPTGLSRSRLVPVRTGPRGDRMADLRLTGQRNGLGSNRRDKVGTESVHGDFAPRRARVPLQRDRTPRGRRKSPRTPAATGVDDLVRLLRSSEVVHRPPPGCPR